MMQPRALVVDDEPGVRHLVRRILESSCFHVTDAADGADAFLAAELDEVAIDLLVTDVVLPGMSGPALADRLRRSRPAMRVLFMSGYLDDATVRGREFDPEVEFLAKPFTIDALEQAVRNALPEANR